jgi:serine/threonine protein kinase
MHECRIINRDIKPANILIGIGEGHGDVVVKDDLYDLASSLGLLLLGTLELALALCREMSPYHAWIHRVSCVEIYVFFFLKHDENLLKHSSINLKARNQRLKCA